MKRALLCLLQVKSLPDQTSEAMVNFCREYLTKLRVNEKNTVYDSDNINRNFYRCFRVFF